MAESIGSVLERIDRLERALGRQSPATRTYPGDPMGYIRDVLRAKPTPDQERIAQSLLVPPFRTIVDSGHSVGKTWLAAALTNWWYDTYDPGVVITTAPTERDVVDLLWTEVRLQRQRVGLRSDFIGGRAPEMRTSDEHYAKGYTARDGMSFVGRHRERMLFIFDEADSVASNYYVTTKSMFKPESGHAWLCIGNPISTSSQAALEQLCVDRDGKPAWHVFNLSALDHPNLVAERKGKSGKDLPCPNAVSLAQVDQWIRDWCELLPDLQDMTSTDIEWPPGSATWWRPGPVAEARILGRRPSAGTWGVWSAWLWDNSCRHQEFGDAEILPEVGCDVARYGDDWTSFHVRWGPVSIAHESYNGLSQDRVAGRLKHWAQWCAAFANGKRDARAEPVKAQQIRCKVDDSPVSGGVIDLAGGYAFVGIQAGGKAQQAEWYPNKRSELWFRTAERARRGLVDLSRLPRDVLAKLRQQALAPEWAPNGAGQRVVEPKEETKARIGRSPDDMDALNLAYYDGGGFLAPSLVIPNVDARAEFERDYEGRGRMMFGKRG